MWCVGYGWESQGSRNKRTWNLTTALAWTCGWCWQSPRASLSLRFLLCRMGYSYLKNQAVGGEAFFFSFKSTRYDSGLGFWNVLFPLGLLYYKLKMSVSTFQNVQTTEKQYIFCDSFGYKNLTWIHTSQLTGLPGYIFIFTLCWRNEMMYLSGCLIDPEGVGDVQHCLFWNTSSPPAFL